MVAKSLSQGKYSVQHHHHQQQQQQQTTARTCPKRSNHLLQNARVPKFSLMTFRSCLALGNLNNVKTRDKLVAHLVRDEPSLCQALSQWCDDRKSGRVKYSGGLGKKRGGKAFKHCFKYLIPIYQLL